MKPAMLGFSCRKGAKQEKKKCINHLNKLVVVYNDCSVQQRHMKVKDLVETSVPNRHTVICEVVN